MKKYLAILLTAALLLCAAPLAGFTAVDWPEIHFGQIFRFSAKAAEIVASGNCGRVDEEGGLDGSQVTWTLDSDGLLTISGHGDMEDYFSSYDSPWAHNASVKNVIIKNGVTSIGVGAFYECTELTSVAIGGGVTSEERDAIYESTGQSVMIGGGVGQIGNNAFYGCTGLTAVTIPDSVRRIGDEVFYGCTGLISVTIGNSVTQIGSSAFSGCTGLTSVMIPDSVTNIGEKVFLGCSGMNSVTIGNSVESIGDHSFLGCNNLTDVTIPKSVKRIGGYVFYGCSALKRVSIPEGVTSIGAYAFWGCESLLSVTIPDSVTELGDWVFYNCTKLADVTIGKGVTSIGNRAFFCCSQLTGITIPDSVTSIGEGAFEGCTGLTSLAIPDSMTSIGDRAFSGCSGLETITVNDGNPVYHSAGNCLIDTNSKTLVIGSNSGVIPSDGSVTAIGDAAFADYSGLTSVTIPDTVTSIGGGAFRNTGLTSVVIPDSVTELGAGAFNGCGSLVSVRLSENITSIYDFTFYRCSALKEINLPDGVTHIGMVAFNGCSSLTELTFPKKLTSVYTGAFIGCSGLKRLVLPEGITFCYENAFSGCSGLTEIQLPHSFQSIAPNLFSGCTGLTNVTVPDGVKTIMSSAFRDCVGLGRILIPTGVTEIEKDAIPEHTVICGYAGSYAQEWAEANNRVFELVGDAAVTLNAPAAVNEPAVNVYGFANPGAEVVCSVNGNAAVTVQASAYGRWSAEIPLTGAKDGDSFTVKAAVTVDGKTAEQSAAVLYKPDAIVFSEFTMNHNCYSITVAAEKLGLLVQNVTYVPGQPVSFKIKVSNPERLDKLYVVSTKDGESKRMSLIYDAASGYWFAEGFFDEADHNYVPGVFTITGVDKDGREFDVGPTIKVRFLIDPSGYVYEGVPSNKLEGVTAAVYYKDKDGHELLWNAETADQLNPVTTLSDGAFAWVVPEGQWQVRVTKPGYMEARSAWMDVPPEYTDVYIAMTAEAAPEVESVSVYADRAEIVFTQYMDVNTVNTENVTFAGYTGNLKALDAEEPGEGSGIWYAKTFSFTPEKAFSGEISVKIENAANYVGNALTEPFTASFTVAAEPKHLTAAQETTVKYGETAEITVSAENAAGKTVRVACDSANVTLSAKTLTLDGTGKATLTVTGAMPGAAELSFTLEGTLLKTTAAVTVPLPEAPAEPAFTPGDVDGNGKIESADARLALRASVKLEPTITEGSAAYKAADYNGDGDVKSEDARAILRVSVKLDPFA